MVSFRLKRILSDISYLMRTILCLLALLALSLTFKIDQHTPSALPALSTSTHTLKFSNFSGFGVTKEQIVAFTSYANSASSFYKDDV